MRRWWHRRRRYRDADGLWFASDEVPGWWVRADPAGTRFQARHKAGRLADVEADSWRMLLVFTWQRHVASVRRANDADPPRQMGATMTSPADWPGAEPKITPEGTPT